MTSATILSPEENREFVRLARKVQGGASNAWISIVDEQPVCFVVPDVDDLPMIDLSEDSPRARRINEAFAAEKNWIDIGTVELEVDD